MVLIPVEGMSSNKGEGAAWEGRFLEVDLSPLKFLKALVVVCFLAFSYFKNPDEDMEGRNDTLEGQYFFLLRVMKYWGSRTVQVIRLISFCPQT